MSEIDERWINSLVNGFLRSFAYIVGVEQLKMFVSKAGEAIMASADEDQSMPVTGSSIPEIVKSVGDIFVAVNPTNLDWKTDATENGVKLSINKCPFSGLCSEMIGEIIASGRVEKKRVPCLMSEFATGSCRVKGIKARATIDSFSPGHLCVSEIAKSEV